MGTMGRWTVFLVSAVFAAGCAGKAQQVAQTAPQVRQPAPPAVAASPERKAQEKMVEGAGIAWNYDYADGLAKAKAAGKPVMVDVFATWCGPCKLLDESVFSRADVVEASRAFVTVRVDGDKNHDLVGKLKVEAYPTVLFLTPDGKEIGRSLGAVPYQNMLDSMAKAKAKFAPSKGSGPVAGGGTDL